LSHIANEDSREELLINGKVFNKDLSELKDDLQYFKEFIKLKYGEGNDIPF
jgi:hypothetical protein